MRKSSLFFGFIMIQMVLFGGSFIHAIYRQKADAGRREEASLLVRKLGLTDLCLFTEANYTRNPSLADFHAAFQDAPMALEHFPSGSLIPPPMHTRTRNEDVD